MREADQALFPLVNVGRVVQLFRQQLCGKEQPDLVLLSIVAGAVEHSLTSSRATSPKLQKDPGSDDEYEVEETADVCNLKLEPAISWVQVSALYHKYIAVIKGYCDLSLFPDAVEFATKDLIKRVSDILWNTLSKDKIKDRTHISNIFSYVTESKLDCFGVAFGVVAGCQVLGFNDVHLAMSEDHAWVVYGPEGHQTVEVTWHEKRTGDRRGEEVGGDGGGGGGEDSWVYGGGYPVICTRGMEVAAVVSAMSPAISPSLDSLEVSVVQQELLWLLYDLGHLNKYPMALGNLGDLEEGSATPGRPNPAQLYHQGVLVNQKEYNNRHVYPYMYSAGYNYRAGDFKLALQDWAGAAAVLKGYRHGKDDEEIYKEFMEINNELIPHLLKTQGSLLLDSSCFSNLLQFYDGLCSWEENSSTPVLHIGWVKPMVKCISQFDAAVRANIEIPTLEGIEESTDPNGSGEGKKWNDFIMENNNYKTSFDCLSPEPESLYQQEPETDFLTMNQDTLARFALECREEKTETDISSLVSYCGEQILDIGLLVGNQAPCPKHINSYLFTELEKIGGKSKKSGKEGKSKSGKVHTRLYSAKMSGLKDLLQSERLNSSALHLQLTAQSQGETRRKGDGESTGGRLKRVRRE